MGLIQSKKISIRFRNLIVITSKQQMILFNATDVAGRLVDNFLWAILHTQVHLSAVLPSLSSTLCRYSS